MDLKRFIDETPTIDEALELFKLKGSDAIELCAIANKVREKYVGNKIEVTTINNAKSGKCSEDCKFCAQSAHHKANIDEYSLKDVDKIVEEFDRAINETNADTFCIVTATKGLVKGTEDYARVVEIVMKLRERNNDIKLCASVGLMNKEVAAGLKAAGVNIYNSNIQTAPSQYGNLVATTHKIEDRIEALRQAKEAGLKLCTGGILGLGETKEHLVEMAFQLKELDADTIPLNILIPIEGTKTANNTIKDVADILKTVAIFRIINKKCQLKIGAGRERRMKDFMGQVFLSGANCLISGGYLTTSGRSTEDDIQFVKDIEQIWNS